jgi:aryl-alcohol dehydrogenase-like predicted oxidoreductase
VQPPYHLFRRDIETNVLPYTAAHDIGVLVYGPLAHGLLGGHLRPGTTFPDGDWRANSDVFTGESFARNLRAVAELEKLARDELGTSVSRLAVAWTLANPAVHVAIVGTRDPGHVDDAIAAADLHLDDQALSRIDTIMRTAVAAAGPSPASV